MRYHVRVFPKTRSTDFVAPFPSKWAPVQPACSLQSSPHECTQPKTYDLVHCPVWMSATEATRTTQESRYEITLTISKSMLSVYRYASSVLSHKSRQERVWRKPWTLYWSVPHGVKYLICFVIMRPLLWFHISSESRVHTQIVAKIKSNEKEPGYGRAVRPAWAAGNGHGRKWNSRVIRGQGCHRRINGYDIH